MISEETLRKYFDAVVLSNYSPGEMGWLWKEFLFHKDILDEEVEKLVEKAEDGAYTYGYNLGYSTAKGYDDQGYPTDEQYFS